MPILWKRLASGFVVSALFVAFARSLGFDWVPALSFVTDPGSLEIVRKQARCPKSDCYFPRYFRYFFSSLEEARASPMIGR
jgi:hypothetical protein